MNAAMERKAILIGPAWRNLFFPLPVGNFEANLDPSNKVDIEVFDISLIHLCS
jgi:hypothetical protein